MEVKAYKVAPLCELLGISRWGYYKHVDHEDEESVLITSLVLYCNYIRAPDNLPKAGCRELLELCRQYFGVKFTLGRDRFYDVLRANGLMLRKKRYRPRTTDSIHNNRIWPDLLNTTPKLVARRAGVLVVADITYVYCSEGFGYLSLLTDAAFTRRWRRTAPHRLWRWLSSAMQPSVSTSQESSTTPTVACSTPRRDT